MIVVPVIEGRGLRVFLRFAFLWLLTVSAVMPGERCANWTGNYSACDEHSELLKTTPLTLAVRFSTSDPELAAEVARALDFWATVLDMEWHEDDSRNCAIQIVDGGPDLFISTQVARAQLPNRPGFEGWIAFNPKMRLPATEEFFVAVHELGHVFGLPHNSRASSIMYYLNIDGPYVLDEADLRALDARHRLRNRSTRSACGCQDRRYGMISWSTNCGKGKWV